MARTHQRHLGPRPMSEQRKAVCAGLLNAMTNKEIAKTIGRSEQLVEWHVTELRDRYQARNRVDLALKLYKETAA